MLRPCRRNILPVAAPRSLPVGSLAL